MNQASIFTMDKGPKGYKDFSQLPTGIYVDSSAWVCAYGSQNESSIHNINSKRRGREITEFISACVENGVDLYHSGLVLSEVIHANKFAHYNYIVDNNIISIPQYNKKKVDFKKLNEIIQISYPDIVSDIEKDKNGLIKLIRESSIHLEYEDDAEFFDDMEAVIEATGGLMDTQDAKHVVIARSYSINSFLTADGDFVYLDNDNVFVPRSERYTKEKLGRSNVLLDFKGNEY